MYIYIYVCVCTPYILLDKRYFVMAQIAPPIPPTQRLLFQHPDLELQLVFLRPGEPAVGLQGRYPMVPCLSSG